jgi:hypothetical protein
MTSAVALDSSVWQGTRIGAPAVAGFIIATVGNATPFFIAGGGYLAMAMIVKSLRMPAIKAESKGNAVQDLVEGVRFVKRNSIFSFLIGMVFFNSFFGMSYIMLMPIFAVDILDVGSEGQGVLMSVGAAGGLLTTLRLSAMGATRHKGLLVIGGAAAYGLALASFGLSTEYLTSYYMAMAIIFIMGVFQSSYMISIISSLQIMVPDDIRGRVMGLQAMTWSIMPLGGMQAGAIASVIGAPFAVAIGGFAVSAFAVGPAMINRRVRTGRGRPRDCGSNRGDGAVAWLC